MSQLCSCYCLVFFIYMIFNISRYATVGYFTWKVNQNNANRMEDTYRKYSCDCYYISKDPASYQLPTNKRFDLAHIVPQCTDCDYCEDLFNNSATNAFEGEETCPIISHKPNISNYTDEIGWFSLDVAKASGCPSRNISLSAMIFWTKDYNTYSWWAVSVSAIYCFLLSLSVIIIACIFQQSGDEEATNNSNLQNKMKYILRIVCLYNLLVSEILLYLFYKPLQYNSQTPQPPDNVMLKDGIKCEICSIDKMQEDFLNYIAFISFCVIILQILYTIYRLFGCGYKCCRVNCICCKLNCGFLCKCDDKIGVWECCNHTVSKHGNFGKRREINIQEAKNIHQYGSRCTCCLIMPNKHCSKYIVGRNIFIILSIALFVILIIGFVSLIYGVGSSIDEREPGPIHIILALLPLSFVDNPWLIHTLYKNCKRCLCDIESEQLLVNDISRTTASVESYGL